MAITYSTSIIRDGLVLALDAANTKSVPLQNLIRYSQNWATSPWELYVGGGSVSSMTNNASSAPDGTNTASLYNISTWGTGASTFQDPVNATGGTKTYRMSFYFKAGTYTGTISPVLWFFTGGTQHNAGINVNVQTGIITSGSAQNQSCVSFGNGWYRASFTVTGTDALNTKNRFEIYHGGAGTLYYWGAQVTDLDAPSTYLKTEASAITNHGTWYDLSGNNRNATINGSPTFSNGYFDITSDTTYISASNSGLSPRTEDFTYSAWVWYDSFDGADTLFENGSWGDALLFRYQGNAAFYVYAEGALSGTLSWVGNINQWYNIVFRRYGGVASCYVNGVSTGTPFTMTTDINLANPNIFLMRSQHTTGQFTDGKISAFSVYSRGLTVLEISQNFNALRGRYGI